MPLCVRYMCLYIIVFLDSTYASWHGVASSAYARGRHVRDTVQLRLALAWQIGTKIANAESSNRAWMACHASHGQLCGCRIQKRPSAHRNLCGVSQEGTTNKDDANMVCRSPRHVIADRHGHNCPCGCEEWLLGSLSPHRSASGPRVHYCCKVLHAQATVGDHTKATRCPLCDHESIFYYCPSLASPRRWLEGVSAWCDDLPLLGCLRWGWAGWPWAACGRAARGTKM